MQESQVARAEVGSRERVVETRPECLPAEGGLLPIAVRHAGSAYPDLAYLPIRQLEARCRIHDPQFLVVDDAPAAHCAGTILAFHRARGLRSPTTADHERRLGQAVARVERLLLKTTAGERVNEALQRGGAYRLCAIECDVPRRQIQPNALRGRDPLDAYVISEVGTSADRGPLAGDRLQPARWSSQKGHGGHQCNRKAALDPLQDAADQTHIVERRQPDDTTAVRVDLEAAFYLASVVQQVRMAHHDATRRSGRARCVLQNGQIVRRLHRLTPRLRHTDRQRFSRQPRYAAEVRLRGKHGSHLRLRSRGAECYRWPCVAVLRWSASWPLAGHAQQPAGLDTEGDRDLAQELTIGLAAHISPQYRLHAQLATLEELDRAMPAMGAGIQTRQQRQQLHGVDLADQTDIEQSIVDGRTGCDQHAAAVARTIGDGYAERATLKVLAIKNEAQWPRAEYQERPQNANEVRQHPAQPWRSTGAAHDLGVEAAASHIDESDESFADARPAVIDPLRGSLERVPGCRSRRCRQPESAAEVVAGARGNDAQGDLGTGHCARYLGYGAVTTDHHNPLYAAPDCRECNMARIPGRLGHLALDAGMHVA